jgi:hypothetical protein
MVEGDPVYVLASSMTRESAYLATLRERLIRAEVWLRMVAAGVIPLDPVAVVGAVEGTPSFTPPEVDDSSLVRGAYE